MWVVPALAITTIAAVVCAFLRLALPEPIVLWGRYYCIALGATYLFTSIVCMIRVPSLTSLHPIGIGLVVLQDPWGSIITLMLLILPVTYTFLRYVQVV